MVLLDSSVWVAYIDKQDPLNEKAESIISEIDDQLLVPYCVVAEVAAVLTRKVSKPQADRFIESVINNEQIEVIENSLPPEALFFMSFQKRLSFPDYAVVFWAREKGCTFITFDKQQERFYKSLPKIRRS